MAKHLTPVLLTHLAEMARLSLSPKEKKEFFKDLNKILEAFSEIKKVSSVRHLASGSVVKLSQLKPKKAVSCVLADELLERAPDKKGRYFRVPKIERPA